MFAYQTSLKKNTSIWGAFFSP